MNSPEKRDDDSPPPRRNRSEMDAHERKLWDLEDGDDLLDDDDFTDLEEDSEPETPPQDEVDPPESDDEPEEKAPPVRNAPKDDAPKSSLSPIEKISLGIFGILILAIAAWLLSLFFKTLPTDDPTVTADFPVEGKNVVVKEISTYWRKPTDEDRGVRPSAKVIPAGIITLGESSGQGALRIFFEDDAGDLVGDAFTVAISGGKFSPANTQSLEVNSSDGFSELGDLPGYLTGQIDLWYMVVKEGPSTDASGREFEEILRLPIARDRR